MGRKVERNVESKVANKNVRKSQRKTTQRKIDQVVAEKEAAKVTQRQHLINVLSRRAASFQTNIVYCCVAQNIESLSNICSAMLDVDS